MGDSRRQQIIQVARTILEADGPAALTMRAIADALGIKAPSLYKHFPDKDAIHVELIALGLVESADAHAAAVDGSDNPLRDLGMAYRAWALAHPHLYRLMTDGPIPRDRLPEGLEARAARPVLEAAGHDQDLARAAWGLAHGLTSLELAGRFPPDVDPGPAWIAGTQALARRAAPPDEG